MIDNVNWLREMHVLEEQSKKRCRIESKSTQNSQKHQNCLKQQYACATKKQRVQNSFTKIKMKKYFEKVAGCILKE